MRLDLTQAEFRHAAGGDPWGAHKRLVNDQFQADSAKCGYRGVDLVRRSGDAGDEVVLLPARALVHSEAFLIERYDLSACPLVVAGALDLSGPPKESAIAARGGAIFERFDDQHIRWFDGSGYSVMAVISSTIKRLVEHPDEEPTRSATVPPKPGPVLLLDAGHHPYSNRYRINTLRCAVEAAEERVGHPAAVVLASWQFATTEPTPSWCMPTERATCERVWTGQDLFDIIDVRLA